MKINFAIDTEDLYGENGTNFEDLLTDSLRMEIIKNAKGGMASEKFKEFSLLASNTLIAEIKLRLGNFLSEDVVLTGRYGEKDFVGSIEDLIKLRFDDVILRPVDSSGKTLQGCTSSGQTWIEWAIEKKLQDSLEYHIKIAKDNISKRVEKIVSDKIIEIKNDAIKHHVDKAFVSLVKKD